MKLTKKESGYFTSFDGTKIYYEVRGKGPPLIFAYGIGCLINHWEHQIKFFPQNFTTIAFDYRIHHKSETPNDPANISVDAIARDVLALTQHLRLERAHFVGHSFGIQVLIRAFELSPDTFSSLSFINGFASNPIKGMFGTDLVTKVFSLLKQGYDILPDTISHVWKGILNNPLSIQLSALLGGFNLNLTHMKDMEIYARGMGSMELDPFLTLFESMMEYDGTKTLATIDVPTLIIAGKQDTITPVSHQELMHRKIPHSEFLLVPYGSHCTQLDMPDFVNLKIEKFVHSAEKVKPSGKTKKSSKSAEKPNIEKTINPTSTKVKVYDSRQKRVAPSSAPPQSVATSKEVAEKTTEKDSDKPYQTEFSDSAFSIKVKIRTSSEEDNTTEE